MARTRTTGRAARRGDLPATIERSDAHARRIFSRTREAAMRSYDDPARASRTAFASLKHSYEKVGDHWERKARRGPSDAQAAQRGVLARRRPRRTAGGVDATASKRHLSDLARRLGVRGRSTMDKGQLVNALDRANRRASASSSRRRRRA